MLNKFDTLVANVVPSVKHGVTKVTPNAVHGHKKDGKQQKVPNPTEPIIKATISAIQQASKPSADNIQRGTKQTEVHHVKGINGNEHIMQTGAHKHPK